MYKMLFRNWGHDPQSTENKSGSETNLIFT